MYFCAIFLFPIRLILMVLALTQCVIFNYIICTVRSKNDKEIPGWKMRFIHKSTNWAATGVCFACGLIFPRFKKLKISDFDKTYPDYSKRTDRAPVIVSNHVSWLDPMLYSSFLTISYLSKAAIGKTPFFGTIGRGVQSIWLNRESSN